MSGLLVRIGWKGPRISRGASGFISQVSNWLGAPRLKIMITDCSSLPLATAPMACSAARLERVKARAPSARTWRKSRRVMPSQVVREPLPETFSIIRYLSPKRGQAHAKIVLRHAADNKQKTVSSQGRYRLVGFFSDSRIRPDWR